MDPLPRPRLHPKHQRGDVPLLLVFVTLALLLLGAVGISVIAIGNIRGAGDIATSAAALYGADTAVERAQHVYAWDTLSPTDTAPSCLATPTGQTLTDQQVGDIPMDEVRYDILVNARAERRSGSPVTCESLHDANNPNDFFDRKLGDGRAALCMEARGKARGGAVQRRVTSDAFADDDPTCGR